MGVRVVLRWVMSLGLPTAGYIVSYLQNVVCLRTDKELYRNLSCRERAAGVVVLIVLYYLRTGSLRGEANVVSRYLRILYRPETSTLIRGCCFADSTVPPPDDYVRSKDYLPYKFIVTLLYYLYRTVSGLNTTVSQRATTDKPGSRTEIYTVLTVVQFYHHIRRLAGYFLFFIYNGSTMEIKCWVRGRE